MKHACAWIVATLFVTMTASAQTQPLSLGAAIELALENDIRLLSGKAALQLAQIQQKCPSVWEDPEARFETALNSDENEFRSALRLYFPHPWRLKAASHERAAITGEAEAEHLMAATVTASEVYWTYREFQCLEKEILLANRLTEIQQVLATLSDKQVKAGMQTSGQALLLHWELREAKRTARTLCGERAVLKNRLASLTGLESETLEIPVLEFPEIFSAPDAVSDIARRPDLMLRQAQLQQASAQVKLAQSEGIPWFNHVQTGYSDRDNEWGIQVALSIPVFSLRSAEKRAAFAEQSLWQAVVGAAEKSAKAQMHEALAAFNAAAAEWTVHREEQRELANATHKEIEKLKEFAPSAPGEWLKLEERLVEAERDLLKTLEIVYSARANLLFASGQTSIQE